MSEKTFYTLKEASQMLQLSEHTIRYYSNLGLFTCPRDASNRRVLDESAISWLKGIKYLRDAGGSIPEVKKYCSLCRRGEQTTEERRDMLAELRVRAKARLHEVALSVRFIEKNLEHCEAILNRSRNGAGAGAM